MMMPTAVTAGQTGTSSASHVATSTGGNADCKLFFPDISTRNEKV